MKQNTITTKNLLKWLSQNKPLTSAGKFALRAGRALRAFAAGVN